MSASMPDEYRKWLVTRPESVQRLAEEFPPMTSIEVHGVPHYVFAYDESDGLIVTPVDPRKNYDFAYQSRRTVCAAHVRDGSVKLLERSKWIDGVEEGPNDGYT